MFGIIFWTWRITMIDTTLLNENQKEAVLSDDKYLRIIAGAGSGKTRVLTMRIVHLIEDEDVRSYKILAITFTNKAANEMKERLSNMLVEGEAPRWISTIHSLCVRILREDISVLGYPKSFTIMDSDDQKTVVKEAIKQLNLQDEKLTPGEVVGYISNNKSAEITVEHAYALAGEFGSDKSKAKIYEYYLNRQKEMFALDFDDLILKTVQLFENHSDVLEKWQRRFEYVLVDEFQDIDNLQYKLIRFLTGKNASLYVVGDPDQTIYTWRGANVDIIMNFERDFPNTKTIMLNENYRSTSAILNASNSVIANNKNRLKKELYTSKKDDSKVIHYSAESEEYEDAWIASKIVELHSKGKKYSDIAILYRSNYLSRGLERSLIDARVPYIIYGGIRFYDRMEIKDLICYLRMIVNADDLSLQRILNRPKRGIGSKTMDSITDTARFNGISMYEVLKENTIFSGKNVKTIQAFVDMIEGWKKLEASESISLDKLVEQVIEESGIQALVEADEEKKEERQQNLKAFVSDIKNFSLNNPTLHLDEYLQNIALYTDREDSNTDHECVELMTVHAAKGLEFDTVFVSDLNDGIFPNKRALDESNRGIEEERRLAYVAFTRAMNQLYVCEAGGFSYVIQDVRRTSRFIKEIDKDYMVDDPSSIHGERDGYSSYQRNEYSGYRRERSSYQNSFSDFMNQQSTRSERTTIFSEIEEKPAPSKTKFKKNDIVVHPKFGEGVIVKVKRDMLNIAFEYPYGIKTIAIFPGLKKKGE